MKGIIIAVLLVCLLAGTAFAAVLTSTTQTITQEIVAPPPSGGGGGGGGGPTGFPPVFSNISNCGITETTADICWETDLYSTSQVEYWSSPSIFSELDKCLVRKHHVHLTGLTLGTTYHYKVMSKGYATALAVSDEYTFTTLGEIPVAIFTSSDLSISPSEVGIGEAVTITALIFNSGNAVSSHGVMLKINDVAEAIKKVTIDAGASKGVTFTTARDVSGSYSVDVNGLSGSFTVREEVAPAPPAPPPAPPPVEQPINWPLIGSLIGGAIIVGVVIFFRIRRRVA